MLFSSVLLALIGVVAAELPTHVQNRAVQNCYPVAANSTGGVLTTVRTYKTPHGFTKPPRGWNSWGVQASMRTTPSYPAAIAPYVNQTFIMEQCTVLADPDFVAAGYDLCSIDGGWYSSITDDHGRVVANSTLFDIPTLGTYLHGKGLKLGIYSLPGIPCNAATKYIANTTITVGSTFSGVEDTKGVCYFDYSNPDTQLYHDSLIKLWASWGVDMIKLDFITPGSITGGIGMPADVSNSTIAFHKAIQNSGRQIRLDISSNVCRNDPYLGIWQASADSMRIAVDINTRGAKTFLGNMWKVQGTIEQYRLYINSHPRHKAMTLHADMDNAFVGNPASVSGVTDGQRITIMSHWIGASANLILGSDMTNLDALGRKLVTSAASIAAANFCGSWPMQPRNPGTGSNQAMQLQAWVAGPDSNGQAYVLLTNLGPNLGRGGYANVGNGTQSVTASLSDLGLTGANYTCTNVWSGGVTTVNTGGSFSANLGEGESQFLQLTLI